MADDIDELISELRSSPSKETIEKVTSYLSTHHANSEASHLIQALLMSHLLDDHPVAINELVEFFSQ